MKSNRLTPDDRLRSIKNSRLKIPVFLSMLCCTGLLIWAQNAAPPEPDLFESQGVENPKFEVVELAFIPDRVPELKRLEVRDDLTILEGDIVIGDISDPSKGLSDTSIKLWRLATVNYVLPHDYPNRSSVEKAIKHLTDKTDIEFKPIDAPSGNCLVFVTTSNPNIGGQSHLGRVGNSPQNLWMNENTSKWNVGTVIHEIGHALGLMHEQCRNDRDQYVEIVRENILQGYESQFSQLSNGRDLESYDFESVMHYPAGAFARPGTSVTIKPRPPYQNKKIGQRQSLSDLDIKSLHLLYKDEIQKRNQQ